MARFVLLLAPILAWGQANPQFLTTTHAGMDRLPFDPAVLAFAKPAAIAADLSGNLYVSEAYFGRVLRIAQDGSFKTVAEVDSPGALTVNGSGDVFVVSLNRIVRVNPAGETTVLVADLPQARGLAFDPAGVLHASTGSRVVRISSEGDVNELAANLGPVAGIAFDSASNLYVAAGTRTLRVDPQGGTTTAAENLDQATSVVVDRDGNLIYADRLRVRRDSSVLAEFTGPLAIDGSNTVFVLDQMQRRIRQTGSTATIGGPVAPSSFLIDPAGLAVDSDRNIVIADFSDQRLRRAIPGGDINDVAPITGQPRSVVVDSGRKIYVSTGTGILRVTPDGTVSPVADTPGATAGLAIDTKDNLYGAVGSRVILIEPQGGVSTVVDNLVEATDVAVDKDGTIYVAESTRIRRFPVQGLPTLVAFGLDRPTGLALDSGGNLYFCEGNRVWRVDTSGNRIPVAGTGSAGISPDGGSALYTKLNNPSAVAFDPAGHVFIADRGNHRILRLDPVQLTAESLQNFASHRTGPISAGEVILIDGDGLGPADPVFASISDENPRLPDSLGGTQVFFDGVAAPLLYVQSRFVILAVPFGISGKESVTVQAAVQNSRTNSVKVAVAAASPGIYTRSAQGDGLAVATNDDGTANTPGNPAVAGSIVTLTATGLGDVDPDGQDGAITSGIDDIVPSLPLVVLVAGQPAEIFDASSAEGQLHGVIRLLVRIPDTAPSGSAVPITLKVNEFESQPGVYISVQ